MCGIAGIVDFKKQASTDLGAAAERMSMALAHRGPDDAGIVAFPLGNRERPIAVLAHRRLAILDLTAAGHQPMATTDQRFWITFNGEIYNFRELRKELENHGVPFRSQTDTEVILQLFVREGSACLGKLRGMFAFAIWDAQKRELFLARDRFGIKPLYYSRSSEGLFLFASDLKALLASGLVAATRDEVAEVAFLQRGSIAPPSTFYQKILALPPAHFAWLKEDQFQIQPYWSLAKTLSDGATATRPMEEVATRVREALTESVKAHMVSDVPVGVFLSGGLDSTAIVAAIRSFYTGPLRTFNVMFPGTQWDESSLARKAAEFYGTEHTEVEITEQDFANDLESIFGMMDQPTVDGVNTFFVAKAARVAGGKVALSGVGGDEILGGYPSFVEVPKALRLLQRMGKVPGAKKAAAGMAARLPIRQAAKLAGLLRGQATDIGTVWNHYRAFFTKEQILELGFTPSSIPPRRASLHPPSSTVNPQSFWAIAQLELEGFLIPQLLRDADVFTMGFGLELRTPLVDHEFLRAVVNAGGWSRGRAATPKLALFQAMKDFLPPQHLGQPKRGFVFPFETWLRNALADNSNSRLGKEMRACLTQPYHEKWIRDFLRGQAHWSRVWGLYVLERAKGTKWN